MIENSLICPYTGLRSFTEEESLYFKGRELQVDQITSLLEQNKFLMVTGASGEGKSSLVYAGLIPNARAGFFKARYTNWIVADFRPERSPVENMSKALAKTFGADPATVETELRRGFSSLVDLYLNSAFYIDESGAEWNALPEKGRQEKKRKAANLIILVDQFEEFFTNPENFYNEAPSQDSQIVVNLLLETARIAIKKNLPVFVICTMRSDYIGQCSAFRGLPEYIGFSQFFVPRLKRKDLKQVIEEPAILSGNRISQRLIERLVFDLADGIDQLPILQHALSQVWLAADRGKEEMDLLHYAMVGGMPSNELPDDDQLRFKNWFDDLPETRKKCFLETGLNKVIEIHASILYENAWENSNYTNTQQEPITQKNAKRIIALTFSCLTKIDNSRAVRNRMSLAEITAIINLPAITPDVVANVLSIFRADGNSFIRPFITEDPASNKIGPDTVLDITHESLIRNWNKLNTWANQEFEYYSTFLDFRKQLDRWKNSGKKKGFLLPIGPLAYFENWYAKCKPNTGWIKRYSEIQDDPAKANLEAQTVLTDVREFIKRSASKVAVTRAFMKYGAKKIAVVSAIVVMLILTGFYWYDANQKRNSLVISKIHSETVELMKSKEIGFDSKGIAALTIERYEPGYINEFLKSLDTKARVEMAIEIYGNACMVDKSDTFRLRGNLRSIIQAGVGELMSQKKDYPTFLVLLNKFSALLAFEEYFKPSSEINTLTKEITDRGLEVVNHLYRDTSVSRSTLGPEINFTTQQWLRFGSHNSTKIDSLIAVVSPLENNADTSIFNFYYPKGSYELNGDGVSDYNGGYQAMASLYAAKGETDKLISCLQLIKQTGQNDYFTKKIIYNNYQNIIGTLYQFGFGEKAAPVVGWVQSNYPSETPLSIYNELIIKSGYMNHRYSANIARFGVLVSPSLCLSGRQLVEALNNDYETIVNRLGNSSEKYFLLAMNKKRKALYRHRYEFERGIASDTASLNKLLEQAVAHYRLVDKTYLEESIPVTQNYFYDGVRTQPFKRKQLFVYPDYMGGWFSASYHTDLFFNFITDRNLAAEFYTSPEDIGLINRWLATGYNYFPYPEPAVIEKRYPMPSETLQKILAIHKTHPQGKNLDVNLVSIMLANRAFDLGDTVNGNSYYLQFNKDNFAGSRDKYEYLEKTYFLNQLNYLCANLAGAGKHSEALELAEKFELDHEKAFAYINMAEKIYAVSSDPMAFVYLDSVFTKSKHIDFSEYSFDSRLDHRNKWILLMSRIGGRKLNSISVGILAEVLEGNRFRPIALRAYGMAEEGNFYRAKMSIPGTLSETQELQIRSWLLLVASDKKQTAEDKARWSSLEHYKSYPESYIFYAPN